MPRYEYKVVPAPKKAGKIKGVKGTDNRFATALATVMNDLGAEGWEYRRTDTLPCEERQGLTGKTTTFQTMLVFRRDVQDSAEEQFDVATEVEAEPMLAAPTFRATSVPALGSTVTEAEVEGDAPAIGPAASPEGKPSDQVAAQ